jgi:hypothetical protein
MAISEHNFRAQLNQRFANDFCLPYAIGISRAPFRRHLAARAARIQQELLSVKLLDSRYAELAVGSAFQIPAFLAIALRGANRPEDLWLALAEQRREAARFRSRRAALDMALADGDVVESRQASKALHTEVDHLSSLAAAILVSTATAVTNQLAQGTPDQISVSVAAAEAAVSRLISSSLADRILWRLRRPQLLYINNIIDQARHITNALPACVGSGKLLSVIKSDLLSGSIALDNSSPQDDHPRSATDRSMIVEDLVLYLAKILHDHGKARFGLAENRRYGR